MIDPLPAPFTHLTHELIDSPDLAVITLAQSGKPIRGALSKSQVDFFFHILGRMKFEMEEVKRISAIK